MDCIHSKCAFALGIVFALLIATGCSKQPNEPKTEEGLREKVALLQEELQKKEEEIQGLEKKSQAEIEALKSTHAQQIKNLTDTVTVGKQQGQNMLAEQKKQYEEQIGTLQKQHQEELEKKKNDFESQIATLKEKNLLLENSQRINKETEALMARLPGHYQKQIAIAAVVFILFTMSLGAVLCIYIFKYNSLKSQLLATINSNLQESSHE